MLNTAIQIPLQTIQAFCEQHPIQKLALFGSILRDDFTPDSDVDMLVTFMPSSRITFFDMFDIEQALSELIGHPVDLRTAEELSRYFRDDVVREAVVIYERK